MQAKGKDKGAMEEIIKRYTPFVVKTARSIYVKGQELEDLIQIGQASIIKAVNMYDTTRENAFTSYVFNTVKRTLYLLIRSSVKDSKCCSLHSVNKEGCELIDTLESTENIEERWILMANYRQVQTDFWQDDFILDCLLIEERYVYLYLMTNPRTTQCGIYKLVKKLIEAELGLDWKTVEKIIDKLISYGKVAYSEETNEIMLINWIKYNFINSRNTILCINKELKKVKNKEFIKRMHEICLEEKYPVDEIFDGIQLDIENNEREGKVIPLEIDNKAARNNTAAEEESYLEEDGEGLFSPYEATYKPLGEEETKEEIYINKYNNKQKSNNIKSKDIEKSISRVLVEFSKNIKKASKVEVKKFKEWREKFDEDFIIAAIKQAVKYNVKHIGYIEGIIKNWEAQGVTTTKEVTKQRDRDIGRVNFDAYRYVD